MGRKRVSGLIMRAGVWHIDKVIFGRRICQSTGTSQLEEAERRLARVMEETRQAQVYGVRPSRTFEQAAAKFVLENQHKRSIGDDVSRLKGLYALDRSCVAGPHSPGYPATLDCRSATLGRPRLGPSTMACKSYAAFSISLQASGWMSRV